MRKGRVGAGESQGCVWVGSHVWLPKVPSRRTCWLRRLRHCPSSLLPATGCSVQDVVYLLGYGAQLQPAMTQSSSSRKIHLRTLFESSTPSVHKQHELRLSSASTAPCGQLPLQSPAPSAGRSYKDTEATATSASKHQADEPAWGQVAQGPQQSAAQSEGPRLPREGAGHQS